MSKRKPVPLSSDSSDEDEPLSTFTAKNKNKTKKLPQNDDSSSSESDIENYLQPANKIDLTSPFFNPQKSPNEGFNKIESEILSGVSRVIKSDSESENDEEDDKEKENATAFNFGQFYEYTKKIEEAKRHLEKTGETKKQKSKKVDIKKLLKVGEKKENKEEEEIMNSSEFESCSDSEKEGWEEVVEKPKEKAEVPIPKQGLEITVEMPTAIKKKKSTDLMLAIKRRINRVRKENQVLVHKVHLLCWLAHGNYVNSKINSDNVLGVALSLLPSEKCYPPERTDLTYLEQILKWYKNAVELFEKDSIEVLDKALQSQISKKTAYNKKMLVYIFVAILRSLGIQCRLVLSLQIEPLRPPASELHSLSTKNESKTDEHSKSKASTSKSSATKTPEAKASSSQTSTKKAAEAKASTSKLSDDKKLSKSVDPKKTPNSKTKASSSSNGVKPDEKGKSKKTTKEEKEKPKKVNSKSKTETLKVEEKPRTRSKSEASSQPKTDSKTRSKSTSDSASVKNKTKVQKPKTDNAQKRSLRSRTSVPQLDGANDSPLPKPNLRNLKNKQPPCPIKNHPKRLKTITKYKDSSDSEDEFITRAPFSNKNRASPKSAPNLKKLASDVRNDVVNLVKKSLKESKDLEKSKQTRKRRTKADESDDSDYMPEPTKKKQNDSDDDDALSNKPKVKRRIPAKPEEEEKKKKLGNDVWVEVFLENEEKWISVDVIKGQVHCVKELFTRATHPVSYVIAWNNNNTIKDITTRYCMNFNTVTRKLRIDQKWWQESLKPFIGKKTARDKEEDEELEKLQMDKPLPTVISEYKNHPLYVLKRHLLKFEALYPPDPPPLGYVRNEPVYSRQCVYVLHSRDIWLKHAKVVKPGEQPYKIVKARPKWDKLSNAMITDQMLEVFGPWQTQDYEPPTAENGVVPRNAFGNVELFKPCMLPKKTVHLKLPGLNKVAKKLNIDCAPALVGFDFHGGWNHPTYEGYIVCEEFADVLKEAWEEEQEEQEKREQEKIDKRVYGNWKRLIRGLLIRERLKAKYEFGESSKVEEKKKAPKFATKKKK